MNKMTVAILALALTGSVAFAQGQGGAGRVRRKMDGRHFLRKPGRPAQKHPRLPVPQINLQEFVRDSVLIHFLTLI